MKLSRIKISKFKSLDNIVIDGLKEVNIFMGQNNSGKSSILHAIYLAKYKRDPFSSTFEDCIFLHDTKNVIEVSLETIESGKTLTHEMHWRLNGGIIKNKEEFSIDNIYYLAADRGIFERDSNIHGGKVSDVGPHGQFTNRNMVYIKQNEEEKFTRIRKFAMEMNIGTKNIDNLLISESNSQVTFEDPQSNQKFRIQLGGFGQIQLLPMIVQAFDAPSGSVLLYEEPEISLHPGAQRNLLEKFTKFVTEENKQLFFTSHSNYFLNTIQRWSKEKNSLLDKIALYNVNRTSGITSVTPVPPEKIEDTFKEFYQR